MQGGLSNLLFKVAAEEPAGRLEKPVLVRVFGPLERDSEQENRIAAVLGKRGLGPLLLATFGNGRVEEFLEGHRTLAPSEFLDTPKLAQKVAQLHALDLAASVAGKDPHLHAGHRSEASIWVQIGKWLQGAEEALSSGKFSQRPAEQLAKLGEIFQEAKSDFDKWQRVFNRPAVDVVDRVWAQIRLCHNDLHVNNTLVPLAGSREVRLIDFEYACLNHVGMDLCNSLANIPFMEYIDGLTPTYDASRFPSPQQIQPWLERYLSDRASEGDAEVALWVASLVEADATDPGWETALRSLMRYRPVAQLQWIPWGIRLAGLRGLDGGFDFLGLAMLEFEVYKVYLAEMERTDPAFYADWNAC